MRKLTKESAVKLQNILAKRLGHKLTDEELEQAYDALMDFAMALVDLDDTQFQKQTQKLTLKTSTPENCSHPKIPVENYHFRTV